MNHITLFPPPLAPFLHRNLPVNRSHILLIIPSLPLSDGDPLPQYCLMTQGRLLSPPDNIRF